ncbi:MAG: DUF4160 domain-containing protein [Candidatus Latescibacteria bacterium]|nr:DUF4160 domain-containing protein [Candidatus Latescibacterota bacterium]
MLSLYRQNVAKVWLQPVEVASNRRYNQADLARILRLTRKNRDRFLESWNEYFGR